MPITNTKFGAFCDNDWEQMQYSCSEKFCKECNKEVIDFTKKDRKDILRHYQLNPNTCGRFNVEQIDTSLIPIENFKSTPIALMMSIFTVVGIQSTIAKNIFTAKFKTEIIQISKKEINHFQLQTESRKIDSIKTEKDILEKKSTQPLNKYYLSWRFPFIHNRINHLMGCPKF